LVAQKELLDLIRDRRTIITALVVPLVSFPVLFGVVGFFANPVSNPSPVAVLSMDPGPFSGNLTAALSTTQGIHLTLLSAGNLTAAVQNGTYDVALLIPSNFSSSVQKGAQANVTLYFDPTNGRVQQGLSIIRGVISGLSQQIAAQRLRVKGVTGADLNPVGIRQNAVGKITNQSLLIAAGLFPSFLLYFTFLGGFYFMVDDIAGEKERRSLEPLFVLPTSRTTIFLGKYSVAFLLSMITASLGLIGTLVSITNFAGGGGEGFSIPLYIFPPIFAVVALAALSLSALGFCISTFAKNIREAQQYLSPVFFIFFIPIYFTSYLPQNQVSQYAAIPLLGYVVLIRDLVIGQASALEIVTSIGTNVVTLVSLIWLGLRLLESEKVILRAS
jgi:sodium transport system permease protein